MEDRAAFMAAWDEAERAAEQGYIALFGMHPTEPATGYGYIQHEGVQAVPSVYKVKTFTEKPNKELAKTFISSGDFLWNAGIFVWQVKRIVEAFHKHLPEMYDLFHSEQEQGLSC